MNNEIYTTEDDNGIFGVISFTHEDEFIISCRLNCSSNEIYTKEEDNNIFSVINYSNECECIISCGLNCNSNLATFNHDSIYLYSSESDVSTSIVITSWEKIPDRVMFGDSYVGANYDLDSRYYKESEIDDKLSMKFDISEAEKLYDIFEPFEKLAEAFTITYDESGDIADIQANGGLSSISYISALGMGDSSSSGSGYSGLDITAMWDALTSSDSTNIINISHIPTLSISQISNLQESLDAKLNISNISTWALSTTKPSYSISEINGFDEAVDPYDKLVEAFTIMYDSQGNITDIQANAGLSSISYISALGTGESSDSSSSSVLDLSAMWSALANNTSEQIESSHLTTALSNYITTISLSDSLSGYATITYVDGKITDLIGTAPENLDTLHEIAAALSDSDSTVAGIVTTLATKLDSSTAASTYATLTSLATSNSNISTLLSYFTSGVANSATELATARTIWGQSFDGSANVSGALTGVTSITASSTVSAADLSVNGQSVTNTKIALWDKISALFDIDDDGNVYVTDDKGFYSNSFISAMGTSDSSGTGVSGLDLSAMWEALTTSDSTNVIDVSHIPTLFISNISSLQDSLDAKLNSSTAASTYATITSLTTGLSEKLDTSSISSWALATTKPSYSYTEITGLSSELANYATITYVDGKITDLIGTAPENLDTLQEIAAALSDNDDTVAGIITTLATKLDKSTAASTYATLTSLAASNSNIYTLQSYFSSGVANSATELATARTIWGQSFDGSANVSGALTGVTSITASSTVSAANLSVNGQSVTNTKIALWDKISALFDIDDDGNVYVTDDKGFYSNSFISALGTSDSDSSGSGLDLSAMWEALATSDSTNVIDISHIPTLSISKISSLQDSLDAKLSSTTAASTYATITSLTTGLSEKLDTSSISSWALATTKPSYAYTEITGLTTALSSYLTTSTAASTYATITNLATANTNISTLQSYFSSGVANSATTLYITDNRGEDRMPDYYSSNSISTFFNMSISDATSTWMSGINVKGWTEGYASWQLFGLASSSMSSEYGLYYRQSSSSSTWFPSRRIWTDGDFDINSYLTTSTAASTYATLTSLAASNSNISTLQGYFSSGVANSATKLATSRTIWGQSFDGTAAISGSLTGVTSMSISGTTTTTGAISSSSYFYSSDRSAMLRGSYNSSLVQGIWSMSSSYVSSSDGSDFGNLYGLAYKNDTAYSYGGSHCVMMCIAGNPTASMGLNGLWGKAITTTGSATIGGSITATGGISSSSYISALGTSSTSDMRMKENIESICSVKDFISSMDVFSHTWRESEGKTIGISAQWLRDTNYNYLVHEIGNKLSVDYKGLQMLSLVGLKETNSEVDNLKEEIKQLKSEIKQLNDKLWQQLQHQ